MSEQIQNGISDELLATMISEIESYISKWSDQFKSQAWEIFGDDLSALRELQQARRELASLRASHKRMMDVLEEIERHHLELNRAKGRPANHSHTLRLCAAALAEARKLEDK